MIERVMVVLLGVLKFQQINNYTFVMPELEKYYNAIEMLFGRI